jgi:hypothetical protein
MRGPRTAQARATLAASPSNVGESACRQARSRVPAVLLSAISAACEVSGRSACWARARTGTVARHARYHRAAEDRRRTGRLPAASARDLDALRGGARQSRDSARRDRRRGAGRPHPPTARSLPSGHAREELLAYLDCPRRRRLARPPAPGVRRPDAHRRSAAARMDCQTAFVSLTLRMRKSYGCPPPACRST